ncbi:hypothetical protein CUU52_07240 [Pectobacterium polaris]|nr:hypothetical protein [Pectobacterium polaris]
MDASLSKVVGLSVKQTAMIALIEVRGRNRSEGQVSRLRKQRREEKRRERQLFKRKIGKTFRPSAYRRLATRT